MGRGRSHGPASLSWWPRLRGGEEVAWGSGEEERGRLGFSFDDFVGREMRRGRGTKRIMRVALRGLESRASTFFYELLVEFRAALRRACASLYFFIILN